MERASEPLIYQPCGVEGEGDTTFVPSTRSLSSGGTVPTTPNDLSVGLSMPELVMRPYAVTISFYEITSVQRRTFAGLGILSNRE